MKDDILDEVLKTRRNIRHFHTTEILVQKEIDDLLMAINAGETEPDDFVPDFGPDFTQVFEPVERQKFLAFADLADAEASVIRYIVERVTVDELAKALIREDEALRKVFYRNMPLDNLKTLDEKLKSMDSFEAKEKNIAQRRILAIAKKTPNYSGWRMEDRFDDIEEFIAYLTWRRPPEAPYGLYDKDVTMCRFSDTKNGDELLADIESKNQAEGMGNVVIPGTNVRLINFSICPKCGHSFSFKDLQTYYLHPRHDPTFKNTADQFRNDTRVFCMECGTYFLPALVIADGTPKSETQFLCRIQTMHAIEDFYSKKGIKVLSKSRQNLVRRNKKCMGIVNDVLLKEMEEKPVLIANLLQYTPANLALNLLDGSNVRKGDLLYGAWE